MSDGKFPGGALVTIGVGLIALSTGIAIGSNEVWGANIGLWIIGTLSILSAAFYFAYEMGRNSR